MTVQSTTEWKTESAWVTVLTANTDLAAFTVRRGLDASSEVSYPCVIASCRGASPHAWEGNWPGYDVADVELSIRTSRYVDKTGQTLANGIAAVRDTLRSTTILADLSAAVQGYHVYGITQDSGTAIYVDDPARIGSIPLAVHCTVADVDASSSSSSSSSP